MLETQEKTESGKHDGVESKDNGTKQQLTKLHFPVH